MKLIIKKLFLLVLAVLPLQAICAQQPASGWMKKMLEAYDNNPYERQVQGGLSMDEGGQRRTLLRQIEENPYTYQKNLKFLWPSMGDEENITYENFKAMRQPRRDRFPIYTYFEYPGGHT